MNKLTLHRSKGPKAQKRPQRQRTCPPRPSADARRGQDTWRGETRGFGVRQAFHRSPVAGAFYQYPVLLLQSWRHCIRFERYRSIKAMSRSKYPPTQAKKLTKVGPKTKTKSRSKNRSIKNQVAQFFTQTAAKLHDLCDLAGRCFE